MKLTIRIFTALLALLMVMTCFAACGKEPAGTTTVSNESESPEQNARKAVKDTVPTNLNYGGDTVTFFVRADGDNYRYEMACEELLNDTLYDAIHYRNIDVEQRLGVKVKTVEQIGATPYNEYKNWNNTLSTSVLTNQHDFDGTCMYMSTGTVMARDNIFYNLILLSDEFGDGYFNFEKPWWNPVITDELTYCGAMFFAAGDVCISETSYLFTVEVNKDIFEQKFPEDGMASLYETVRNQTWTIEKMTEYVDGCWDDLNSNGVVDNGDVVGYISGANGSGEAAMDAWIYAMGLDLTQKDEFGEPQLAIFNSYTVPAYEKVKKMVAGSTGSFLKPTSGEVTTSMKNGDVLFCTATIASGSTLRDSAVNYGILPLPKYDEAQENYRTVFGNYASVVALCSNLTADRAAELSAVLELLCAESYKTVIPTYYSKVLQGQYSKDQPDAEMYDIVLGSSVFTFGYAYSSLSLDGVGNIFRDMTDSYSIQTTIDSKRPSYEQKLKDLLAALEAVA